jgi:hypothetical protein
MLSLALTLALTLAINANLSANLTTTLNTSLSLSGSAFKAVNYHVSSVDTSTDNTPVKDDNPSPSRGSGRRE